MIIWLKGNWERTLLIIVSVLFIGNSIYSYQRLKKVEGSVSLDENLQNYYDSAIIPKSANLDFSNQSGASRISSGFTDLLVNSEGSTKKGEGYEVYSKVINTSSVYLTGSKFIYSWYHNGQSQATTVTNPGDTLVPGGRLANVAFLSPVEGDELKSVFVYVDFDYMRAQR